jgi:hypothetical protein
MEAVFGAHRHSDLRPAFDGSHAWPALPLCRPAPSS